MSKKKLAHGIVKARYALLVLVLLCAVCSALSIGRTRINYDLTRYLSDDTMTKRALAVMEKEFGSSEQLRVMFVNQEDAALAGYVAALNELPQVLLAAHDPEAGVKTDGNATYQLVTLTLAQGDPVQLVSDLRALFPEAGTYYVGGSAASQLDVQRSVGEEIPRVMIIAVAVVLLMLLVTSHAWLEPVVILTVLTVSIVINMGTNFIFPDVSFITFAVSAILQLALSIDYAIMLLHTFNACREGGAGAREAMEDALSQCFMRISSSAMTTVAGLLSLLFMSFTIGFDIGLTLSKGIVISMLCVFLLMPALTLLLQRPLDRTRHRQLPLGGDHLARGIERIKRPLAAVMILIVLGGLYLNSQNEYIFTHQDQGEESESARINQQFGSLNPLVALFPGGEEDADYARQRSLADRLLALKKENGEKMVSDVAAMVTTGEAALKYYTAQDVIDLTGLSPLLVRGFFLGRESIRADKLLSAASALAAGNETVQALQSQMDAARAAFIGPNYGRMLLSLNFNLFDDDFTSCMEAVLSAFRAEYGEEAYITGIPMSNYDIANAFRGDLLRVNIITLLAILLIVTVSFRSLRLPLLLVFVIEGAIWINMGCSRLVGDPIFFISYLICLSIQMGATIDYGILLSDQYRSLRWAGFRPGDALADAMKKSLPTILTSGIILIVAGYLIGRQCSIYYISSIGLLVSRGALISVILVLSLLPAVLLLGDRLWVQRRKTE